MDTVKELSDRYQALLKNIDQANEMKVRLEERKKAAEKNLRALVQKVTDAGYDIKNLDKIREEKISELKNIVESKEKEIVEVMSRLKAIEAETSME
jgi:DNA repair exonuclease SbcCD ATPase subunit